MAYPRVLTIQDISCVGQCSLTVALPIIAACGVETCVLPSAVLSTHTGGFSGYTFRDLTDEQANTATQQWLMTHCWEYGFILRYPKGTTNHTGIIYEPWHYRYVGLEMAKEITESGLTLEEYLGATQN